MAKSRTKPRFGGVLFSDGARTTPAGKIDCYGVFTTFLAWAYPTAPRKWQVSLTVYDLSPGSSTISASIRRGRSSRQTLATIDVAASAIGNVVTFPLVYSFPREGDYLMELVVVGTDVRHRVPLRVTTQEWPEFSEKEVSALRVGKGIPQSVRAGVTCAQCKTPYTYEETPLNDLQLASGVLPFPDSGVAECQECGEPLHLKDLQGQLRASLKNVLREAMGRK